VPYTLRAEATSVVKALSRVASAWAAWCGHEDVASPLFPLAQRLSASLRCGLWEDAPPRALLLQLPGVS
jgi:hypothetical protein